MQSSWHVEPRSSTMILDWFTLKNDSDFDRKDFVIECDARGNSDAALTRLRNEQLAAHRVQYDALFVSYFFTEPGLLFTCIVRA
jgi:hypothetical protein